MRESDQRAYLNLCIRYRILSLIFCTLAYLLPAAGGGGPAAEKVWIASGMAVACFLGVCLYRRALSQPGQETLTWIIFSLELFAYGIFTFLSGGFASPYFWYYIGCLFIMTALRQNILLTTLGAAWCMLCAAASRLVLPQRMIFSNMELNLVMGAGMIIGGFYIVLHYIRRLTQTQEQQRLLNLRLKRETERSEQAIRHITDLYDVLNLFAMTDPYRVMEELNVTLRRTIAPEGCILVKLNLDGTVEKREVCGVEETTAAAVAALALRQWQEEGGDETAAGWRDVGTPAEETGFEAMRIGRDDSVQGSFIRRKPAPAQREETQDNFYRGLIEIIFRNLDTQKQLEEYITTEEQNRLAGEIHDTVIQKLFGLACSLKVLEVGVDTMDPAALKEKLRMLKRSAELTMAELRQTIYGGRFEGCDGDVFFGRLRLYMEEMEKLSGAAIRLDVDEGVGLMTAAQKITMYQIACEAVNNAVRHGKARQVMVRLRLGENAVQAEIEDDGTGFIKARPAPLCGKGLKNMQRMTRLLNGRFILESERGHGTKIEVSLPR